MVRETMHENVGMSEDPSVRRDEEVAEMKPHGFWIGSVEPTWLRMRLLFEESALTRRSLQ